MTAVPLRPTRYVVLADLLPRARARSTLLVLGGAAAVGVAAQVAVPIPGTPVPLTLQTFAVLLVGICLGTRRGAASMAVYAVAGLAGVPWFAHGPATLGYVIGFIGAAATVGACAQRRGDRTVAGTTVTMTAGSAVIYACGVPVLMYVTGMTLSAALASGVVPFLLGDALKIAVAAGLVPLVWRMAGRS